MAALNKPVKDASLIESPYAEHTEIMAAHKRKRTYKQATYQGNLDFCATFNLQSYFSSTIPDQELLQPFLQHSHSRNCRRSRGGVRE